VPTTAGLEAHVTDAMRHVVVTAPGVVWIEPTVRPTPGAGEVLVSMRMVGICGSDVHYFHEGRIGDFVVEGLLGKHAFVLDQDFPRQRRANTDCSLDSASSKENCRPGQDAVFDGQQLSLTTRYPELESKIVRK